MRGYWAEVYNTTNWNGKMVMDRSFPILLTNFIFLTNSIFCIHVKLLLPPGDNPITVNNNNNIYYYYYYTLRKRDKSNERQTFDWNPQGA